MAKPLTAKQEMFCLEYLIDLNATQAAIRAGYSEKTAHSIGNENLIKPLIQECIAQLMADRSNSIAVDAKYVLKRLVEIDELDVVDILDDSGCILAIKDWPKSWRTSITGLDVQEMMGDDINQEFNDFIQKYHCIDIFRYMHDEDQGNTSTMAE